jgi:FKBP-type peptidyl-prolyl cis-trans isomerase SlyD
MQITTGSVVVFDYTLTDDEGDIIDSSTGSEPLAYIQGEGQIVPGLEKAMEGKSAGDSFKVTVEAEEGYGEHDPENISVVSADKIEGGEELEEGMQLHTEGEFGEETVLITKIEGNEVTIDGNHPLAGLTLHFDVTIRDVRPATEEELEHGHVHGPGGHHH